MKKLICEKLREIEQTENVRILYAAESGSRAWGFASPDSDYDVRFIYVRPLKDYLRLNKPQDVIELSLNDVLDINGWDVSKALCLLQKSNPSLFEWFSSPVVYVDTAAADEIRRVMGAYFSVSKSTHHYFRHAANTYRAYLMDDQIKAKKYFYALRPVLACRWILERKTPPPMQFSELAEYELPQELRNDVNALLNLKINSPEIATIPPMAAIHAYLEASFCEIANVLKNMEKDNPSRWEPLNDLFYTILRSAPVPVSHFAESYSAGS